MRSLSPRLALWLALALVLGPATGHADPARPYRPSPTEVRENYRKAQSLRSLYSNKALNLNLQANWYDSGKRLWYRRDTAPERTEFVSVNCDSGERKPLFDHKRFAEALAKVTGRPAEANQLPITGVRLAETGKSLNFSSSGRSYSCNLDTYEIAATEAPPINRPPANRGGSGDSARSPDRKWTARIVDRNLVLQAEGGEPVPLTKDGDERAYYARPAWSPDSRFLVFLKVTAGDRLPVYLVESSPSSGGRAKLITRSYDLPGDKVDTYQVLVCDPATAEVRATQDEVIDYWQMPSVRWNRAGDRFTYEKLDRGYGRWRILEIDPSTGDARTLVDDRPTTFFDITSKYSYYSSRTDEIIWRSEKTGWAHLYLTDPATLKTQAITSGKWVVRSVLHVDEERRKIVFAASGVHPEEDPYFLHYFEVGWDGKGLRELTPSRGNHQTQFSPTREYFVDSHSAVDSAPVHELRRTADGSLVAVLERADLTALEATGWRPPEVFVAKGRDGETDIWGLIFRPSHFDPEKSYPIIEDIYAGPQDSFVPKSFAPYFSMQSLAELGFIVVKTDGMGTRNRSKAFHDVCWKNLGDHGFPDRILWIRAMAEKYPSADLSRIGVFGTSAGGQSSTAALLFHPDFYRVAVSACGCHDNRMDKVWWNEQWMGYPVGPHYEAQSNITHAGKLNGKLLLIVGELDQNVPPESTYRLVDALIKAGKDFDFLMIPGAGHTSGGSYGDRRRWDYFVRHLLDAETPDWNSEEGAGG